MEYNSDMSVCVSHASEPEHLKKSEIMHGNEIQLRMFEVAMPITQSKCNASKNLYSFHQNPQLQNSSKV